MRVTALALTLTLFLLPPLDLSAAADSDPQLGCSIFFIKSRPAPVFKYFSCAIAMALVSNSLV